MQRRTKAPSLEKDTQKKDKIINIPRNSRLKTKISFQPAVSWNLLPLYVKEQFAEQIVLQTPLATGGKHGRIGRRVAVMLLYWGKRAIRKKALFSFCF